MTMGAGFTRRGFLARSLVLGCSAAASPLLTPITLAAAPGDNRLVVIILRGAMDGMHLLRPVGDPAFAALRPGLSRPDDALPLDDFFGLHPDLEGLLPMWRAGRLGFAPAVSTPYRDKRSHFDGQDLLEAGTGAELAPASQRDGWLNRSLRFMGGVDQRTAFAVGDERMLILDGASPSTNWSPEARLKLSPQSRRLLSRLYGADALFAGPAATAMDLADDLVAMDAAAGNDASGSGRARVEPLAAYVADRLNEETRIAAYSLGGWDTHSSQQESMRPALRRLQATLLTLEARLGENWSRTAVLAMTEFGRTAHENGSGGTDHGTGGAMLFAGGAIRGGRVIGEWPGLGETALYEGRDLMPTRDVRAYAGWALRSLFGLGSGDIEGAVFPGLDLGADPGAFA
jgi:uncharacterized protein (DUF1501 family)